MHALEGFSSTERAQESPIRLISAGGVQPPPDRPRALPVLPEGGDSPAGPVVDHFSI